MQRRRTKNGAQDRHLGSVSIALATCIRACAAAVPVLCGIATIIPESLLRPGARVGLLRLAAWSQTAPARGALEGMMKRLRAPGQARFNAETATIIVTVPQNSLLDKEDACGGWRPPQHTHLPTPRRLQLTCLPPLQRSSARSPTRVQLLCSRRRAVDEAPRAARARGCRSRREPSARRMHRTRCHSPRKDERRIGAGSVSQVHAGGSRANYTMIVAGGARCRIRRRGRAEKTHSGARYSCRTLGSKP